ncbi:echinoderm microtubule-associated protein-like 2 [Tubulanus polymorphus]|uniref:echinoderm microtubule-associated protein-like 2 n=1 Tax=Tubulanus polymorphus TaxID=672921 RepID=UPI003DA2601F
MADGIADSSTMDAVQCKNEDGLISHENEEVRDRVTGLEKRVEKQEDEIVCLKSALSDVIRRLSSLESAKVQQQNNLLPAKSPVKTTAVSRKPSHANSPVSATRRAVSSDSIPTNNLRHSSSPSPSSKSSPRSSSTPSKRASTTASPSDQNGHSPSTKDPTYNKEDGNLRIFLKGRPVTTYAPSDIKDDYDLAKVGHVPNEKLKLEWVYGYRGRDCRSNIYFLPTGEIVYFVAAVVVLYNVEEQMQRHYLGHNDDVKCLAVHPDKIKIATGQVAGHDRSHGKPHVRVWDSVSLNTLHIIGLGEFERGVSCLSFSKADGGQYLSVVDESNEHILSIWEWQKSEKGHKITETKCSQEAVLAGEFHPFEKNQIITCGKNMLTFWSLEGGSLSKKNGIFEKYEKPKYILCLCFAENGDILTGDSNGNIFVWGKGTNKIQHAILSAHEGGIFSLCVLKNGTLLSGGGKDRKIIQWDTNYQRLGPETEVPEQYGPVRTLSQGRGNMVLVGTTRNSILQGTLDLEFSPIVQGHVDELWGLAIHPNQHQFITGGYDRGVYLWDALTHSVVWYKDLSDAAHCACYYPDGTIVAIGTQTGRWIVLDMTAREIVAVHTDGNEQIECVEYSPDGNYLALGSRDNYIYIYQTSEGGRKYSRIGKCVGHSSFVTHLDWSEDSQYIMTNSGDYEVLFWTAANCSMYTSPASLRDVKFVTQNCTLSFGTMGIWPEGADGTDVNGCCRNNQKTLVASADDFGKVNLYQYPCCQPRAAGHNYGGHSSHVTSVRFLYDDSRLLSTGGKDTAVMQWEIV